MTRDRWGDESPTISAERQLLGMLSPERSIIGLVEEWYLDVDGLGDERVAESHQMRLRRHGNVG